MCSFHWGYFYSTAFCNWFFYCGLNNSSNNNSPLTLSLPKIYWSPDPWYWWKWPYLETGVCRCNQNIRWGHFGVDWALNSIGLRQQKHEKTQVRLETESRRQPLHTELRGGLLSNLQRPWDPSRPLSRAQLAFRLPAYMRQSVYEVWSNFICGRLLLSSHETDFQQSPGSPPTECIRLYRTKLQYHSAGIITIFKVQGPELWHNRLSCHMQHQHPKWALVKSPSRSLWKVT